MKLERSLVHLILIFTTISGQAKPIISIVSSIWGYFRPQVPENPPVKIYNGTRAMGDSFQNVLVHDQTLAIVEIDSNQRILKCDIIEIFSPDDIPTALGDLADSQRAISITFKDMVNLMKACNAIVFDEDMTEKPNVVSVSSVLPEPTREQLMSFLHGIVPSTKWCGTGDIASSYNDLGPEIGTDRCCRAHDLCPSKLRAYSTKYNLTNNSFFTKSFCDCDDIFLDCMKKESGSSNIATILGNIYFNMVRIPCVDTKDGKMYFFRQSKKF